jgi:hypothetical protein
MAASVGAGMKLRDSSLIQRCALALAGAGALAACTPGPPAGQPIQFSESKQEVDAPSRKEKAVKLPRAPLKWDLGGPEGFAPPPIVVIDPRAEKLRRERLEEKKNWLFDGPALFKDKSPDPSEAAKNPFGNAFKGWDANVERVLGKTERTSPADAKAGSMNATPLAWPASLNETGLSGARNTAEQADSSLVGARESASKSPLRNDTQMAVKALFDTQAPADKTPTLPGMTLSDLLGSAVPNAKALLQEREARREEFNRLLAPRDQPTTGPLGLPMTASDQTRMLMNPVAPVPTVPLNDLPAARNPLDPMLVPLNASEKFGKPRLPFDDVVSRVQTAVPAVAPENRNRQMESLKLMSRPSVLSMPGRPF